MTNNKQETSTCERCEGLGYGFNCPRCKSCNGTGQIPKPSEGVKEGGELPSDEQIAAYISSDDFAYDTAIWIRSIASEALAKKDEALRYANDTIETLKFANEKLLKGVLEKDAEISRQRAQVQEAVKLLL